MKKWYYPASLILIFITLTAVIIPDGYVYGSNTDWLSQHATLAETIRNACLEQHTLLPSWIPLGGGSNGYQFAYYGFLRPDILIGCLLPQVSMADILIWYMLALYLVSVLLCFAWLRTEDISPALSWIGSVLFMTAGCLFHMHRQVMFVNYLPFLLLAFICIRKKLWRWLPLCMALICLSSFYFAISAFAAAGWYWFRTEGKSFWRDSFLKRYVPSAFLAAAMTAALLIPTGLILLEHKRSGNASGLLALAELFAPNPVLNNLLFNEYGMGLTCICLYAILAGLRIKRLRMDSILYLLFGVFGIFSYILNAGLYARPKILIPFMPLVILHCVRYLKMQSDAFRNNPGTYRCPLWPFIVMVLSGLLWFSQEQFPWILAELGILFCLALLSGPCARMFAGKQDRTPGTRAKELPAVKAAGMTAHMAEDMITRMAAGIGAACLLLTAPVGMYITTASTEDWVARSQLKTRMTRDEISRAGMDPLWHFDSLTEPLISGNKLPDGMTRSTMYSSVTDQAYSDLYYDTLMTPIRINNRVALLTSDNPFMLNLLGVRYLETTADNIPAGYDILYQSGENVIAENKNAFPSVYFTDDTVSQEWFETLDPYEKLDVITRKTVVDSAKSPSGTDSLSERDGGADAPPALSAWTPRLAAGELPDGLDIRPAEDGWEVTAEDTCTLAIDIRNPVPGDIVLCQFHVENFSWKTPVVIDVNGIRNKLSGAFAPYPNGNSDFHYQLSTDSARGVDRLEITFSKGHYRLTDVQWRLYDTDFLTEKEYTPLAPAQPNAEDVQGNGHQVLSGSVTAKSDGYLATTVPLQNGLTILADGQKAELVTVNEAFAGIFLEKGEHKIDIFFSPPGKTAGCIISITSAVGYIIFLLAAAFRSVSRYVKKNERMGSFMKSKKEFITYLISGGLTTGVNYVLYAGLLFADIPYLAANSAAWAGAVLTAYTLNRRWVFRSENHVAGELASFAALRFVTLLIENGLLWLLISRISAAPVPAKLAVSVITVAGNYVLCKFGVFRKGAVCNG